MSSPHRSDEGPVTDDADPATAGTDSTHTGDGPTGTGLFVAGTDTGVGKTVVTAGLTGWLRSTGVEARAIKPAQTGAPEDDDAAVVRAVCDDEDAATCLRQFGPALAPRVAADREETTIDYASLLSDCQAAVADAHFAVVEGIGGLRVPVTVDHEVIDLVDDLGLPVLLVARSGLGTLNHTALSAQALRARDCTVLAVLLNEYEGATVPERTNPPELERMLDVPVHTMAPLDRTDGSAPIEGVRRALPESLPESVLETDDGTTH